MRWATFADPVTGADRVGAVCGHTLHVLPNGARLADLLRGDGDAMARAAARALEDPASVVALDAVCLRPPVPHPHAFVELAAFDPRSTLATAPRGAELRAPRLPSVRRRNDRIVGTQVDVEVGTAEQWDYELGIAAVVGAGARRRRGSADGVRIAGLCLALAYRPRLRRTDIHPRDAGRAPGPARRPVIALGPVLVTPDELIPYREGAGFDLAMRVDINGWRYTDTSAMGMRWTMEDLLAIATRTLTLRPGDVISTGAARAGSILQLETQHRDGELPWLRPGDVVTASIERLGSLRTRVVAAPPLRASAPIGALSPA